ARTDGPLRNMRYSHSDNHWAYLPDNAHSLPNTVGNSQGESTRIAEYGMSPRSPSPTVALLTSGLSGLPLFAVAASRGYNTSPTAFPITSEGSASAIFASE